MKNAAIFRPRWLAGSTVRVAVLVAGAVLLLAALVAAFFAFGVSLEKTEVVASVGYRAEGAFSYSVDIRSNTLFGAVTGGDDVEPAVFLPGGLRYFPETIDSIDFVYGKDVVTTATERVAVTLTVEAPMLWSRAIPLPATTRGPGEPLKVPFSVSMDQVMGIIQRIETETKSSATDHDLIVEVVRESTGGGNPAAPKRDSLRGRVDSSSLVWGVVPLSVEERTALNSLVNYKIVPNPAFDYTVALKPNLLLYSSNRTGSTASVSSLDAGQKYFVPLVRSLRGSYALRLVASDGLRDVGPTCRIAARLANPGLWEREFELVPSGPIGDQPVRFELDLARLADLSQRIQSEIGIGAKSGYDVSLVAAIGMTAQSSLGVVRDQFTHVLTGTLDSGYFEWTGKPEAHFEGGLRQEESVANNDSYVFGLTPGGLRLTVVLVLALLVLLVSYVATVHAVYARADLTGEGRVAAIRRKYSDAFVDIKELRMPHDSYTTAFVSSLEDLVKVSDDLQKPIMAAHDGDGVAYIVVDDKVKYQYSGTTASMKEAGSIPGGLDGTDS